MTEKASRGFVEVENWLVGDAALGGTRLENSQS